MISYNLLSHLPPESFSSMLINTNNCYLGIYPELFIIFAISILKKIALSLGSAHRDMKEIAIEGSKDIRSHLGDSNLYRKCVVLSKKKSKMYGKSPESPLERSEGLTFPNIY